MGSVVEVFQVDAFTRQQFAGNPAGVVLGADGLSDAQMQAIARELNNADTAFVMAPSASDHDLRVRFFTPRTEAAFVGHATLAVHAVLATREPRALRRQAGKSGIVEVRQLPGEQGFAIRQAPPPLGRTPSAEELQGVLQALGLAAGALDNRCRPQILGSASTRLVIGLASGSSLAGLEPDSAALARLSRSIGAPGYFLFSLRPSVGDCDVESRMFCPALGIAEDPVSGNAHGMLGVYLLANGLLSAQDGTASFTGAQGHYLGRPGKVGIRLDVAPGGACQAVHLQGQAVVVFATTIRL